MGVKVTKSWTGKKDSLSSQDKKQQHLERRTKKTILHYIEDQDWEEQLKEYNKHASQSL